MPQFQGLPRLSHLKGSKFSAPPSAAPDMMRQQGALPGLEDGHPEGYEPEEGRAPTSNDSAQSFSRGGDVSGDSSGDDSTPAFDMGSEDDNGQQSDPTSNALNTVSDILNFGRQKFGIGQGGQGGQDGGEQVAGNIPSVPAGPGGDQTQPNPFGTRTAPVPFGKRNGVQSFDDGGGVDANNPYNEDTRGAYNDDGPDPVGAVLSGALDSAGKNLAAPMSPMEAGQGDAEMGALKQGANAVSSAFHPAQNTAIDPDTTQEGGFGGAMQAVGQAAQPYMQKIIGYLKGADAAPPAAAAQAEQTVDPQGQMEPGMRKLLALDAVNKQYGPQAAWSLMQHYRQKYDAYKSFAAAANAGVQGKPRDPAAAAMAMSQAYDHLPDGQTLQVKPAGAGFTATVMSPNGKPQTVSLSPQAFGQLTQGPDGQFDNVIEKGLPNVLTKFVQRNGLTADQVQPDTSTTAPAGSEPTVDNGNVDGPDKPIGGALGYTPQLEARARALFPMVSQNAQRIAWMQAQEQQGKQNDIGMRKIDNQISLAQIRGGYGVRRAQIGADSRENVAKTRGQSYDKRTEATAQVGHERNVNYAARTLSNADQAALKRAQVSSDARMRNAANIVGRVVGAGQMYDPKNAADPAVQQAAKLLNIDLSGGTAAPAPAAAGQGGAGAPAQPQQPQQAKVPQVGEIVKGYRFKGGNPADKNSWEPAGQ